jgi:hypothetical protein
MNRTTEIKEIDQQFQVVGRVLSISGPRPIKSHLEEKKYQWMIGVKYHTKRHSNVIAFQVYENPENIMIGSLIKATFIVEAVKSTTDKDRWLNFINAYRLELIEQ